MHNHQKFNGEAQMDKKERLVDAVLKSAISSEMSSNKKVLTCTKAFELAKKFDVNAIEIGRICNQNKIRISSCQLGCFK
jgi:hypothetical protein